MATIKISDLTTISTLNSNTSNVYFVATDKQSGVTGKVTGTALAAGLYANNVLNVGNNSVIFPGVIGQFASNNQNYLQLNLQNFSNTGTGDLVVTADIGSDILYYLDFGITNSDYDNTSPTNSLGTVVHPLDMYIYSQGSNTIGGNLAIGTTASRDILVFSGGVNSENVVAKFNTTGLNLVNNKPLTFTDGSTQTTSASSAHVYANGAFIQSNAAFLQANSAYLKANTPTHVANSASIYANGAFTQANSAFNKANNALANTTGTFSGDLTITGNTFVKTSVAINNANMSGNNQYLIITGTSGNAIGVPSNPGYTIHTALDIGNRIVAESYGTGSNVYPGFIGRRGRGTAASPSAVQNGDIIARLGGNAYGSTKFSQYADARIEFVATETHTDASKGTQIQFWTTPEGSNNATQIGTMNGNTVTFTGTVNPAKGFIYTPNVLSTLTTLNIDFVRDNLVKFNVNDNATMTLSNFIYGKVVEVWITNSAAQNKVITHGCLANNSTSKSTSFTISASSCAYLRYFSIDGDQANTYVSITA